MHLFGICLILGGAIISTLGTINIIVRAVHTGYNKSVYVLYGIPVVLWIVFYLLNHYQL